MSSTRAPIALRSPSLPPRPFLRLSPHERAVLHSSANFTVTLIRSLNMNHFDWGRVPKQMISTQESKLNLIILNNNYQTQLTCRVYSCWIDNVLFWFVSSNMKKKYFVTTPNLFSRAFTLKIGYNFALFDFPLHSYSLIISILCTKGEKCDFLDECNFFSTSWKRVLKKYTRRNNFFCTFVHTIFFKTSAWFQTRLEYWDWNNNV